MSRCNCPQCNPVTGECPAAQELSALQKTVEYRGQMADSWRSSYEAKMAERDALKAELDTANEKLRSIIRPAAHRVKSERDALQAKLTRCREALTPQAQRIAIAEACGWKCTELSISHGPHEFQWYNPGGACDFPPDYLSDLNAMAEAEKIVFRGSELWQKFVFELIEASGGSGMNELDGLCCLVQATAAQRAEAFLRTLNLWTE